MHTAERVAAVHVTRLLEVGPEEAFIRLTRLASTVPETPMVALTVVDDVRSFLKGMPDTAAVCEPGGTFEVPVTDAACRVVVDSGEEVCAPDVRLEPRLRDLRQIHDVGVASWIGVPVLDPGGRVVGNLCAMDTVVRPCTEVHLDTLRMLALAATLQESLVPSHPPRVDGAVAGALVDAANAHAGQRPTDDIGVVVVLVEPRARSTGG